MTRASNSFLFNQSPLVVWETAEPVYTVLVPGVTTITSGATLTMTMYQSGKDMSSTYLTGSLSVSGNMVTLKKFQNMSGGDNLFLSVQGKKDDVLTAIAEGHVRVLKRSGNNGTWAEPYYDPAQIELEGTNPIYKIVVPGARTISSPVMYLYLKDADKTSTYATGSVTTNNIDTIATKTLTGLVGGRNLFMTVYATVNGIYDCVCGCWIIVQRKSGRM